MFPFLTDDTAALQTVVDDVRLYLRDSSGLNTLLCDSTENTDYNLVFAVKMGLSSFNVLTPISSYNLNNLPPEAYVFLIHEAVIEVLVSSGILHSRNRLNYSSGGLSVADHDKDSSYQSWINVITSLRQIRMMEKQYKIQRNIESCYGNIHSEFLSFSNTGWKIID